MITYNMFLNLTLAFNLIASILFWLSIIFNKNLAAKVASICFLSGLICNTIAIVLRWLAVNHLPFANTFETLMLFSFLLGVTCLFLWKTDKNKLIATGCSMLIVILTGLTSFAGDTQAPLVPALKSNWLAIHVLFCFISYAAFTVSFITSLIHLLIRAKTGIDFGTITYKLIIFGYTFLILGITSGSVWGNQAWGSYWNWDPKETWALITLLVYTVYLHITHIEGINEKIRSLLPVIGFIFIIITYFGVNYLLAGLHSYA